MTSHIDVLTIYSTYSLLIKNSDKSYFMQFSSLKSMDYL